jgi:adenylate cyclase
MAVGKVKRKLAAIFSADVKGYSRLMGEDEVGTIRTLEEYRKVVGGLIQKHTGRVVDAPGDNVLAEFASVVDAVESAVEIQETLRLKNSDLAENRRMEFRIGINLGDVVEEGERIYGDGVNIAARIEGLADPGGICVSGTVYDQIENKLPFALEYLGEKSVKNIKTPIRVYRLLTGAPGATSSRRLELPDKPSIAVLPFVNMSGDQEQEYFSDGITEDLITDLSKMPGLFVIARNSVFTYKNKPVMAQQVSQELGVQYLLEGSVRKAGERVRITAQFIDATTGRHLWADRYDRQIGDIFAVQDELTQRIIAVLFIKMGEEEHKRLAARGTRNLAAYDLFLRGLESFNQYTKEANDHARMLFKKALEIDSGYAMALEKMGWTHLIDWTMGWSSDPESVNLAFELGQRAAAVDDSVEGTHCLLGNVYLWRKQYDKAVELYEKSLTLNPNYANGLCDLGGVLSFAGKPQEAVELIERALRLDPFFPYHFFYLGHAYFLIKNYEEALAALEKAIAGNPEFFPARAFRAVTYIELGRDAEARAEAAQIIKKSPGTTISVWRERLPYKNKHDLERVLAGLKKAGMP